MKKKNRSCTGLEIKDGQKAMEHLEVPVEIKSVTEVKDDNGNEFFEFEAYGSTFGNIDLVDDTIQKGAFLESISKTTPVILWQHDRNEPIGMPFEIKEDDFGLFLKVRMPKDDVFVAGRVMPQLRIGSIKAMSIGFRVVEESFNSDTGIRTLIKVDLREVSLVTFPADPLAMVTDVKKFDVDDVEEIKTRRDFEDVLRDSGLFSKKAATVLASRFMEQGEPDNISEAEKKAEAILGKLCQSDHEKQIQSLLHKLN